MEKNQKSKKSGRGRVVVIVILILIILGLLGFIFYDKFLGSELSNDVDTEEKMDANIENDIEKEEALDVTSDEVTELLDKITNGIDNYCGNYEYLKDKKVVASDYSNDLAYKFAVSQLIDEGIAFDSNVTL